MLGYKEYFPDIIKELRIIGDTYNNLPIYAICLYKENKRNLQNTTTANNSNLSNSTNNTNFSNSTNNTNLNNLANFTNAEIQNSSNFNFNYTSQRQIINPLTKDRPLFLITSAFRGSDYISVSMALFMIKYILYGYVNNDSAVNYILENRILWY